MATLSILHPPATTDPMAGRRVPLANVPNAVNSPYRGVAATTTTTTLTTATTTIGGKRSRTQAGDQRDVLYGQPPSKKQIIEAPERNEENIDPRTTTNAVPVVGQHQHKLDESFPKRSNHAAPTALEKKLASVREHKVVAQARPERTQKTGGDNLENIRQWQKHYRRQFPHFVFYFESVSDDARVKAMRQIHALGAREEKFFSKAVTHVVTTRAIPPENTSNSPVDDPKYDASQVKTVKPSALTQDQRKTTHLLDATLQRRAQTSVAPAQLSLDNRRLQSHSSDILSRARELGIKIWALEKLQRVLGTILDADVGDHAAPHASRPHAATTRNVSRTAQNANLEQLLRNEKVNGPADRDMTVTAQDMIALKGYYIYIHDMDEKTKPVMVRDHAKPAAKEDGKWPQFRLSAAGRCPFVEDPHYKEKLEQQGREARAAMKAAREDARRKPSVGADAQRHPSQALAERPVNLRRSPRKHVADDEKPEIVKPCGPPRGHPLSRQSSIDITPAYVGSTQINLRGLPRMVAGEPVASGVQPSNITSAIRSQVVSSAAISSTAPGLNRRVGDTKEVSLLKRKVLERGTTAPSNLSNPSSLANDMRAVINADQARPSRAAKRKAQETLGVVNEDGETEGHGAHQQSRTTATKRKKVEREVKPGYCENCHDKFDDFDVHVLSRKHRKFALTPDNWTELDSLLNLLKRPHKVM